MNTEEKGAIQIKAEEEITKEIEGRKVSYMKDLLRERVKLNDQMLKLNGKIMELEKAVTEEELKQFSWVISNGPPVPGSMYIGR